MESRESELTKDINKYNNDITKAKNKSYKNEAEKTASISKIEKNRNEAIRMRQDVQDSQREIAEMGVTKEMIFTFRDLQINRGRGFLSTEKDKKHGLVTVINFTYTNDPNNPNDAISNQVHELAHAFNFFIKKINQRPEQEGTNEFYTEGNDPKKIFDDMEVSAYQRQYSCVPFKMNIPNGKFRYPYQAKSYSEIDRNWLYNLVDDEGNHIYK